MAKAQGTRAVAATVLAEVSQSGRSLTRLLPAAQLSIEARDRPLLAELCYGVCRLYPRLQALVAPLVKKPLKAKDRDIECLLLLGCYQLSYMRVPDHAAISETVAATRQLNKPWATAFLNGVLRQYQRRATELEAQLSEADRLAHPPWLLEKMQADWPQHWPSMVEANNSAAPMTLRVNQRQQSREDYLLRLRQAGIAAEPCSHSPVGIRLADACDVSQLPGFEQGSCSVQDEASQLVAPLVCAEPVQTALDCCAAPGGKAGHILELAASTTQLDAVDIDAGRLQRVAENLQRLQLTAQLLQGDACEPAQWWQHTHYDAILLDAPCSATGVIRRNPDIKLLRRPADIAKLAQLQGRILQALWPLLRPGGRLIYTTCSILDEENDQTIERFLALTTDAQSQPILRDWGVETSYGRQLLQHAGATDGFYYARLAKAG